VGLRDVAAEAGVSHGLITHYFGTYDALVEAVFARRTQGVAAEVARRFSAALPTDTPSDLLRVVLQTASDPVQLRLVGWAIFSGRFEASDFFAVQQQGLRRVADAIHAASERHAAAQGGEPLKREDVDAALLVVLGAIYAYGFGRKPFLAALGWPSEPASDERFREQVLSMVDAYWNRERAKTGPTKASGKTKRNQSKM
jgi:AcrR family transcriptional regulator